MKATFDLGPHIAELSPVEISDTNGGEGFAHDLGTALRFGWVYVTNGGHLFGGAEAAIADHAANKIKCGC